MPHLLGALYSLIDSNLALPPYALGGRRCFLAPEIPLNQS
jgi:hypothetical protein